MAAVSRECSAEEATGEVNVGRHAVKWTENLDLEQFLQSCVSDRIPRKDILNLVKKRFPFYSWCLSSLAKRLKYFGIRYVHSIPLQKITEVIQNEQISCLDQSTGKTVGYRRVLKILRERHKMFVSRKAVRSALRWLHSGSATDNTVQICSQGLVHKTGIDTMEIRGTDDVPSKVMMTTDALFTITRGESMSKNLTADMERFIDNFNFKRRMRHCSQQRVADELSELSGQTFSQRFISRLESKAITAERFAKIRPLFDKWLRQLGRNTTYKLC